MIIPVIPDIDGFAEMYDLLRNQPELQKRLDNLKKLQDYVNQRIGTLDVVQDIRVKQSEARQAIEEARVVKITAEEEAAQMRAKAEREYEEHKRAIAIVEADLKKRIAEVEAREANASDVARQNAATSAKLDERELTLCQFDARVNEATVTLTMREQALTEKLARMKAIWDGKS